MPKGKSKEDTTMLSMALLGYESEKERIEQKIREIRARLGGQAASSSTRPLKKTASAVLGPSSSPKRTLSPAARKRIATAQKKRWAEHRRQAEEVKE